MYIAT